MKSVLPHFEYQLAQKAYSLTSLNNGPSKCMVDNVMPFHKDPAMKHCNSQSSYVNSGQLPSQNHNFLTQPKSSTLDSIVNALAMPQAG